ncbi:hypothetical protein Pint_04557 [Pistacia integerrima]|uniref:Uncharacterized protein n=1 Tax=Pistacia integerrima TaxID=434235 RepID=A0ACC0Z1E9_9ROSI|nr:hypothetical protein Pint_04557 [Pistacia integerrima]
MKCNSTTKFLVSLALPHFWKEPHSTPQYQLLFLSKKSHLK